MVKKGKNLISSLMGKYQNSLDDKGRMIVPAKYREELGDTCVLTKGMDKCLYIYPVSKWEMFTEKMSSLPTSDTSVRAFVRHFYANAVECDIDKQGRITLPQELRQYANMEKELITVGLLDKIEIWAKEQWYAEKSIMELTPKDVAEKMAEYGI